MVEDILEAQEIIISTQVINEFINVMHKKRKISLIELLPSVHELYSNFKVVTITSNTIEKALHIAHKHHYSYFDSLIIASALENGCTVLFTEDMHAEHRIGQHFIIKNPFKITL